MIKYINFFAEKILLKFQNKRILNSLPKYFDNVVDVGSHHGELYKSFMKNNVMFKYFFMFEPFDKAFKKIDKEIVDKKVIKINKALSSEVTKKVFYINPMSMTSSFSKINSKVLKFKFKKFLFGENISGSELVLDTDILDNYIFNAHEINLLKIDTEGHEMEVLRGARSHIINKVFNFIIIEIQKQGTYVDYEPDEIKNFLIFNSYEIVAEYKIPMLGFKDVVYKLT